jgi:hypothetical protein
MSNSYLLRCPGRPNLKKRKRFYTIGVVLLVVFFSILQFMVSEFAPVIVKYFSLSKGDELVFRMSISATVSVFLHLCWEFIRSKKRKFI